jgi:Flp pilus assembly protein TadD
MFCRVSLYATLVLTTLTTIASAQMQPGSQSAADMARAGFPNRGAMMASISGRVRGPENQPIGDARVEIHDMRNGSVVAAGYTRPNGSFELENIPVGTYEVIAVQGIHEARERLDMSNGDGTVDLRLNVADAPAGSASTVSVAQMKVPSKAQNALRDAEKKFDKDKLDEARKDLSKALDIYPQYAAALTLRGIINLEQGKLEEGRNDLETALKNDPNFGLTYVALGAMYNSSGHFDDALRALDRGVTLMPNSWQLHFEMARGYLGKAQFELALKSVNRAETLVPKAFPPVYLVKAHALLGMKNYAEAVNQYEQYLAADPNGANALQARQELDTAKSFAARAQR